MRWISAILGAIAGFIQGLLLIPFFMWFGVSPVTWLGTTTVWVLVGAILGSMFHDRIVEWANGPEDDE